MSEAPRPPVRAWIVAAAVALLSVLPFAHALGGSFVFDDQFLIVDRPAVHGLAEIPGFWAREFWFGERQAAFQYYRPLANASFAIDWAVWDGNPTGFHLTNLLLHAGASVLAFFALHRWTGRIAGAALAALLWAWHPTKVEAVAWIAGRTDVLCGVGLLLAATGVALRVRGRWRLGASLELGGLFVAFFSKELAVVAPAFVAVEAWAAAGWRRLDRADALRLLQVVAPSLAVSVAYAVARQWWFPIVSEHGGSWSLSRRFSTPIETIGELARATFWPVPLSIQRAAVHHVDGVACVEPTRMVLGVGALLLGLGALVWAWRRGRRDLVAGLALGLATATPMLNLVPHHQPWLVSERFLYVPSLGLALLGAAVLPNALQIRQAIRPALLCAAALICAGFSAWHTTHFRSSLALWTHELSVNPDNPTALRFLARHALREGDPGRALELSVRGANRASALLGHPQKAALALLAAESLALLTPDSDEARVEHIHRFFRSILDRDGIAVLRTPEGDIRLHTDTMTVAWLFQRDAPALARANDTASHVAARAGHCTDAQRFARALASATLPSERPPVLAAMALARCGNWEEARALARQADAMLGPQRDIQTRIAKAEQALRKAADAPIEQASMLRFQAAELLGDRKGAWEALGPARDLLCAHRDTATLYAQAAYRAGYAEQARATLTPWFLPDDIQKLEQAWREVPASSLSSRGE